MTEHLNGKPDAPAASVDPSEDVASAVLEAMRDDGDPTWDELTQADRDSELYLAQHYIIAHVQWLGERGFQILPPGAIPSPKSDDEAMAMVRIAKAYFDGQKRRGKLVSGTSPKPGLILPPGSKLQ